MKLLKYSFFISILALISFSSHSASPSKVKIASWNIRILSDESRDSSELRKIASIISQFDLVAVQEVRDYQVLKRLQRKLPGWDYAASKKVGRGQKEIYAYFWQKDKVKLAGDCATFRDPGDGFIREPYACTFVADEFDFTLTTIHLLYGDRKSDRRKELVLLDEVVEAVQEANGPEDDVILLGDFNFGPTDQGWQLEGYIPLFKPPIKTTIGGKSLYDNIWINPSHTKEFADSTGMIKFDETMYGGNLKKASLEVSDHRPIWAVFKTSADDDPDSYGNLLALSTAGFVKKKPKKETKEAREIKGECPYVASKNSGVFHKASCPSAKRINEENKICFKTRQQAIESGRRPCKRCNP